MRKTKLKILSAFVVAAVATFSVVTIGQAAGTKKMLEAWFGLSNVKYNGVDYTQKLQPFAVNDYTYVRLRDLLEIFDKNFYWDQATRTVVISDKADPNQATIDSLKLQLEGKNFQISQLEQRIQELEAQLDKKKVVDLDDLEEQLNDDYGKYKNIKFKIALSGDEDEITVKISVDLDDYGDKWKKLSSKDKKNYLQDICDDILDEYEDADIEGYIKDSSRSGTYKLVTFSVDSDGDVDMDEEDDELADLEDELNDEFGDALGDVPVSIELEGDEDEITFTVEVNLKKYDDEWDDLDEDEIEDFLYDIYYYIEDEYDDAEITGYIYDTYEEENLVKIYRPSSGGVIVKFL